MPNTSGAVNWVNVFFIDKRQQHDSEINVSFKKARKSVIGDGVKNHFWVAFEFLCDYDFRIIGRTSDFITGIFETCCENSREIAILLF